MLNPKIMNETTPNTNETTETNTPELIRRLRADSQASQPAADGFITDNVSGWLTAQYTACTHKELAATNDSRRWHLLRAVIRDWSVLRRSDHICTRLQLERDRLKLDEEKHRYFVTSNEPKVRKRRDVTLPLTDEERLAIIDKVDEIMGLK